jgi:CHASE3 domain sensor protein
MPDDPYKKMSDEFLRAYANKEPGGPLSEAHRAALSELQRRIDKKNNEDKNIQRNIKEDQRYIKILTIAILVCTLIILVFTVFQFFK